MSFQDKLTESLSSVSCPHKLAFAAACCERLLPTYDLYQKHTMFGRHEELRHITDALWEAVLSNRRMEGRSIQDDIESYVLLEPKSWMMLTAFAENCVYAICHATDVARTCQPESAMWAATQEVEASDYVLDQIALADNSLKQASQVKIVVQFMRESLHRQHRDVNDLMHKSLSSVMLAHFRSRATNESALFLSAAQIIFSQAV